MSRQLHIETPLVESLPLSHRFGKSTSILLKLENVQPSGSFKLRGMTLALQQLYNNGAQGIVTCSAGNGGYTAAYCAEKLGIPLCVVMGMSADQRLLAKLHRHFPTCSLVQHGQHVDEIIAKAKEIAIECQFRFMHPFDNELIWEGNASLIEELHRQRNGRQPGLLLSVVGGGGLLGGLVRGCADVGWHDVPIAVVETLTTGSFNASVKCGHVVTIESAGGIAKSLAVRRVSEGVFQSAKEHRGGVRSLLVSDDDVKRAMLRFADDHRMMVQPACAAALAALDVHHEQLDEMLCGGREKSIVVVVCGGAGVELDDLYSIATEASS